MGYASRSGRASTNPSRPQAFAVCDRCGIWYNRVRLRNQMEWQGTSLRPLYLFVCNECYDTPQQQLRNIVIPADPIPVIMPRTEPFLYDEAVQPGQTGPYGVPVGLEADAVMPLYDGVKYGQRVPVLSITANGTTLITATCSAPHGLATNKQIAVEGLTKAGKGATGFYSVVVTTATAFTYTTFAAVAAGSLITPTTRVITALVGLPRGYSTIPQVG